MDGLDRSRGEFIMLSLGFRVSLGSSMDFDYLLRYRRVVGQLDGWLVG